MDDSAASVSRHAGHLRTACMVLRGVVVAYCLAALLRSIHISVGIITTIVPALGYVVAIERACRKFGRTWVDSIAALIDSVLISATVLYTGGLASDAYALYFVEIAVFALQAGHVPCNVLTATAAALYVAAAAPRGGSQSRSLSPLAFRTGLIMLAGCGQCLLSRSFHEAVSSALTERARSSKRDGWDESMLRITRRIDTGVSLQQTLELILDGGVEVLGVEVGLIALRDRRGRLVVHATRNLPEGLQGKVLSKHEGVVGLVMEERRTVRMCNYKSFDGAISDLRDVMPSAVIATPLFAGTEPVGAIVLGDGREGIVYDDENMEFMESLAKKLSVVVVNANLLEEVRRRADYLSSLNQISMSLTSVLEPDDLCERIYGSVCQVLPLDAFFVATHNPGDDHVDIEFLMDKGVRNPSTRMDLKGSPTAGVIRTGRPLLVNLDEGEELEGSRRLGHDPDETRSIMIAPMRVGGRVVGAISAQSYTPQAYGEEEMELLMTIASSSGIALENARLYQRARELSMTDDLTGLGNYRFFTEVLEREIERAKRYSTPLSLVMIDSDSLKRLNDRYGHAVGDKHLVHLKDVMKEVTRRSDYLVRYAGDEFMIILPGTGSRDAAALAERLRCRFENSPLIVEGSPVTATVSVGVASYPESGDDMETLLKSVDAALYVAKRAGKNRVQCYAG